MTSSNIECARWNNLVYARTLKCGSEFFYRNFTQTAGWTPVRWETIDWNQDRVFSYIMDPIERRHKGIGEFIVANDLKDCLFNDERFRKVVAKVSCIDEHSASLHNIYGDYINRIHWMYLTDDHSIGIKQTDDFLETNGHPTIQWDKDFTHRSSNYLDDIYQEVKNLWGHWGTVPGYVKLYFESDIRLYYKLKK